jgi:hypothetical protein
MSECYTGPIACSLDEGTARTQKARLSHETPPESGRRYTCELDMVTCDPDAAFAFHGTVRPDRTEIRARCQYEVDEKGVVMLAPLKIWNPSVMVENYLSNAIPVQQVGRAVYSNPRECRTSAMSHQANLAWQGVPDQALTCLRLGNKPARGADMSGCAAASETAICEYANDTIAGGCGTKECVREGITTFATTAERVVRASRLTGAQRSTQDIVLANLVRGLRDGLGDCGDDDASCLAKLGGDCAPLSSAATTFQGLGRPALYRAFKAADETCIAEAGERDRPG